MTTEDVYQVVGKMGLEWPENVTFDESINGWINIEVKSDHLYGTWQNFEHLLNSETPGKELTRAIEITIPVDEALDEYLVLHHFDDSEMMSYDDRVKALIDLMNRPQP